MMHAVDEITPDQLITCMHKEGFTVTRDQLIRWHQFGLLHRPRCQALGRGRGMESRYPVAARPQLLALLSIQGQGRRSLDEWGWELWWKGYGVTPCVRRLLLKTLTGVESTAQDARKKWSAGDSDNLIERAATDRIPAGLGRVRRRVGRGNYPTVMHMLCHALLGVYTTDTWDSADLEILAQAMPRAPTKGCRQTGDPDARLVSDSLEFFNGKFNIGVARTLVEHASEADLERARDEVLVFSSILPYRPRLAIAFSQLIFLIWLRVRTIPAVRDNIKNLRSIAKEAIDGQRGG